MYKVFLIILILWAVAAIGAGLIYGFAGVGAILISIPVVFFIIFILYLFSED